MRKSGKKHFQKQETVKDFRVNQRIRAQILRVIDENGEMLGEMSLTQALQKANEVGLDLVEVSPKAEPPVAKIIDYGQHRYQMEKLLKKQKSRQKKVDIKGIRLSLRISEHDKTTRLNQAKKFLTGGNKLKIDLILRGRERQMKDLAKEIINNFIAELAKETPIAVEQPLDFQGGRLSIIVLTK